MKSIQQNELTSLCLLIAGKFGSVLFFSHLGNRKTLLRKCYWEEKSPYWLNARWRAGKNVFYSFLFPGDHRNNIADIQNPGFVSSMTEKSLI